MKHLWQSDDHLRASAEIFAAVPRLNRPIWAARILNFMVEHVGMMTPVVNSVIQSAYDKNRWSGAHSVFDDVRDEVLRIDDLRKRRPLTASELHKLCILETAEKSRKSHTMHLIPTTRLTKTLDRWLPFS